MSTLWPFTIASAEMRTAWMVPDAICVFVVASSIRRLGFVGRKCWMYTGVRVPEGDFWETTLRNLDQAKSTWRVRPTGSSKCWGGLSGGWYGSWGGVDEVFVWLNEDGDVVSDGYDMSCIVVEMNL